MTKSKTFKTLLSNAVKDIITSDDIVAYDDNFVLAITSNKRLVYLTSINDISMLYIQANEEDFVLPFEAHNETYSLIASGLSSSFVLNAEGNDSAMFESFRTGFVCYVIPANTAYNVKHPAQKDGCLNLMLLNEDMLEFRKMKNLSVTDADGNTQVIEILKREFDFEIGRLLKSLRDSLNKNKLDYLIYQSYMFQFYGTYLMRFHRAQSREQNKQFTSLDVKVARAAAIIESDLAKFVSVKDLASQIGVAQATLQRGFKANFGQTINEFVKAKRLEKSAEYLRSTELDVSEIVYKVGLNSRSYFSEIFKREYNMSPREFRNNYRTIEGRNLVFGNIGNQD